MCLLSANFLVALKFHIEVFRQLNFVCFNSCFYYAILQYLLIVKSAMFYYDVHIIQRLCD